MTRKSKPAKPAGGPALRAGRTPLETLSAARPDRTPAHLPGQPGKAGFAARVKPVPLPGKSRGR